MPKILFNKGVDIKFGPRQKKTPPEKFSILNVDYYNKSNEIILISIKSL